MKSLICVGHAVFRNAQNADDVLPCRLGHHSDLVGPANGLPVQIQEGFAIIESSMGKSKRNEIVYRVDVGNIAGKERKRCRPMHHIG